MGLMTFQWKKMSWRKERNDIEAEEERERKRERER